MRLLGVDPGTKRIGLALSDRLGFQASPLRTLERQGLKSDIARVLQAAEGRQVAEIVVGLPLNLDGSEGPSAKAAREFARALQEATPIPVVLFDERLTTLQAERRLLAAGLSRAKRRPRRDELAAAILLEAYLAARRK
jgi:putative Holliday junction resolvase